MTPLITIIPVSNIVSCAPLAASNAVIKICAASAHPAMCCLLPLACVWPARRIVWLAPKVLHVPNVRLVQLPWLGSALDALMDAIIVLIPVHAHRARLVTI